MVIDQRGQVCLNLLAAFTDGKFQAILDIALGKHHAVGLTKTSGSSVSRLCITLHLLDTKPRLVKVALQRGAFKDTRGYPAFHFKDQDDPCDGAGWNFFLELDRF